MSSHTVRLNPADFAVPPDTPRWQSRSLIVGLAGVVFCVIAAIFGMKDFLRGYLIAYMFCLGLTLGCMALLMLQYLTGGFAALSVRRVLEAATKNLPLMFILFIPIAVLRLDLYAWMSNPSLTHENAWYLTQTKWFIRWIVYFAIWMWLGFALCKRGDTQDKPGGGLPRFQGLQRNRPRALRTEHFLRLRGLGDVARSALGLDHLRSHLSRRPRTVGAVLLHHHSDCADALPSVQRDHQAEPVSRSRQTDAGLRNAVCLLLVLAVAHHLVGKSAGRDQLVSASHPRRLGLHHPGDCCLPLRAALSRCCCRASASVPAVV